MATDLDVVLRDLKRQRDDLNRRIDEIEERRGTTAEILERLEKWRERAERSENSD